MYSLSKEQSILSRKTIQHAFFSRIMPLFRHRLFILLSSIPQPSVGTNMRCVAFVDVDCCCFDMYFFFFSPLAGIVFLCKICLTFLILININFRFTLTSIFRPSPVKGGFNDPLCRANHNSMGMCNTTSILSVHTLYRHLE